MTKRSLFNVSTQQSWKRSYTLSSKQSSVCTCDNNLFENFTVFAVLETASQQCYRPGQFLNLLPIFLRVLSLYFEFESVSSVLFSHLGCPPALSWSRWRRMSTFVLLRRSANSKLGWVFPPYSPDVQARIRARNWFFPTSSASSVNGSDPCGPRESGCSNDPWINHVVHDFCNFPCLRTWTTNC